MLTIREYVVAQTVEEAYALNQKRANRVLGGMQWLKMSSGNVGTAIDLSALELDGIEETQEAFTIGAMCTLRSLETHVGLGAAFGGVLREAVRHIVGVQFRNTATVGGSVFSRFGFSDITACLLALDTAVELYPIGWVPLCEFMQMPRGNEIVLRVRIRKDGRQAVYTTHRKAATDIPVLACGVAYKAGVWYASIGARPAKAVLVTAEAGLPAGKEEAAALAQRLCESVGFGTNMRGSAEYRAHIAQVLVRRGIESISEGRAQAYG